MKAIKSIMVVFLLSIILSIAGVSAYDYLSFVTISIPALQGEFVSSNPTAKFDYSPEYVEHLYTSDNRLIRARVYGLVVAGGSTRCNSPYQNIPLNGWGTITDNNLNCGQVPDNSVKVKISTRTRYNDSTVFNGTWVPDKTFYDYIRSIMG